MLKGMFSTTPHLDCARHAHVASERSEEIMKGSVWCKGENILGNEMYVGWSVPGVQYH